MPKSVESRVTSKAENETIASSIIAYRSPAVVCSKLFCYGKFEGKLSTVLL